MLDPEMKFRELGQGVVNLFTQVRFRESGGRELLASIQRCEGPLWQDGDYTPSIVVGTIAQDGNERWIGEIALRGLLPQRALATPDDWRLHPHGYPLLRIRLVHKSGAVFSFDGVLNVEETTMLFAKRKDDTYDYVAGGTMAFTEPEDGIYLTAVGNSKAVPPTGKMSSDEMAAWLKSLKSNGYTLSACDGLGHPQSIEV